MNVFMRMSQLFTKTSKTAPDDAVAQSHALLARAGFVHQEMAGVFTLLPLGLRVLRNIEKIIREEMDAISGQEVMMPALQPKANWITTGRWDTFDVLFRLKSRHHETEYALGPTHEEIVIPLAGQYIQSYKDLPVSLYQIQTKFRDEKRAKSGIIRGREFWMKDMYSFHANHQDLEKYYEIVKLAYIKIFKRCGINAKVTLASGGNFTKKFTHEFMAISSAGEDDIIACEQCSYAQNKEISTLTEKDGCPECKGALSWQTAIEIGNIFDLGTKFSDDFNLSYTDEQGERNRLVIGCYGIGTTRLIGSIVETHFDKDGIIWPAEISPFDIHLVGLHLEQDEVRNYADSVYEKLVNMGKTVLYDDRIGITAGEKFADSDLIGIAVRYVTSKKLMPVSKVEVKQRGESASKEESV